jgi:hypothetical protein
MDGKTWSTWCLRNCGLAKAAGQERWGWNSVLDAAGEKVLVRIMMGNGS